MLSVAPCLRCCRYECRTNWTLVEVCWDSDRLWGREPSTFVGHASCACANTVACTLLPAVAPPSPAAVAPPSPAARGHPARPGHCPQLSRLLVLHGQCGGLPSLQLWRRHAGAEQRLSAHAVHAGHARLLRLDAGGCRGRAGWEALGCAATGNEAVVRLERCGSWNSVRLAAEAEGLWAALSTLSSDSLAARRSLYCTAERWRGRHAAAAGVRGVPHCLPSSEPCLCLVALAPVLQCVCCVRTHS